jgi:hypothetical protein
MCDNHGHKASLELSDFKMTSLSSVTIAWNHLAIFTPLF